MIVLPNLARLRIVAHAIEHPLLQLELANFVGVEHAVDLALDLGEDQLVLGHHVESLCLQHLLLVVEHYTLFPGDAARVLLLHLQGVLARVIVTLFIGRHE
uniref:Uncharacterized protein n=1 Tax=Favella ehrenbergii TaxID=182087 RepID=A0A7S3I7X1_9SPIT|mmetsp:Transcript_34620/g.45535  ORF Transcript_34620/g.45535 Transcript_34620/m.45535 type:complete len:101 (-) Transcript_34620:100-402(-)